MKAEYVVNIGLTLFAIGIIPLLYFGWEPALDFNPFKYMVGVGVLLMVYGMHKKEKELKNEVMK